VCVCVGGAWFPLYCFWVAHTFGSFLPFVYSVLVSLHRIQEELLAARRRMQWGSKMADEGGGGGQRYLLARF